MRHLPDGIIDVHGHVTAPELLARFPMPASLGDIDGMIERKLQAGVTVTVVGSPVGFGTMTPIRGLDNYTQPDDKLASFHDWIGEQVRAHAPHLLAYAYVNPFGSETQLAAAAALVEREEFVGFIVNTSVRGRFLDDPGADDFFAMVAQVGVPVVLHAPAEPAGSGGATDPRFVEQIGRFTDVHLCLAAMILAGRFEADPSLHVLATTGGGALSLIADRLDLAAAPRHWRGSGMPAAATPQLPKSASSYLKQVFVDTAAHSPAALRANLTALGAEHILFGTDSPPLPHDLDDLVARIRREADAREQERILRLNALDFLGFSNIAKAFDAPQSPRHEPAERVAS